MKKPKVILLHRWVPTAVFCVVAAALMFWIVAAPRAVGTAAATRQLPIYCVQRDYKVCSLTFDAAWGNARMRRHVLPTSFTALGRPLPAFFTHSTYFRRHSDDN